MCVCVGVGVYVYPTGRSTDCCCCSTRSPAGPVIRRGVRRIYHPDGVVSRGGRENIANNTVKRTFRDVGAAPFQETIENRRTVATTITSLVTESCFRLLSAFEILHFKMWTDEVRGRERYRCACCSLLRANTSVDPTTYVSPAGNKMQR